MFFEVKAWFSAAWTLVLSNESTDSLVATDLLTGEGILDVLSFVGDLTGDVGVRAGVDACFFKTGGFVTFDSVFAEESALAGVAFFGFGVSFFDWAGEGLELDVFTVSFVVSALFDLVVVSVSVFCTGSCSGSGAVFLPRPLVFGFLDGAV